MAFGRGFSAAEARGGDPAGGGAIGGNAAAAEPAVLSHAFWRRAFAGSPDVLGESLVLDGVARTIVGVLPPESGLPTLDEEAATCRGARRPALDEHLLAAVVGYAMVCRPTRQL
jgi:hypothetical protein